MKLLRNKFTWLGLVVIVAAGFGIRAVWADTDRGEATVVSKDATRTVSVPVETAASDDLDGLNSSGASWPGEILSTADVAIHAAREGQIAEWRVRLGDKVYQGQVMGRLTAPPATIELASALAERSQALIRARAQATATEQLVRDSSARLAVLKQSLQRTRDSALKVAETEAEQNVQASKGASLELTASESLLPLRRQGLRAALERLAYRLSGKLSLSGSSPVTAESVSLMQFKLGIGIYSEATRTAYRSALSAFVDGMRDQNGLPTEAGLAYARSAQNLVANSAALGDVSESFLAELRDDISDDQTTLVEAMNLLTGLEKEIVGAGTAARNAQLTALNADNIKQKTVAETDGEFVKQQAELDEKIGELDRELALAQADVQAAEAGYASIAAGVAGQAILAPRSGVVSAIFKNVGDHVTPETVLAGISSADMKSRFVRFRIPSDQRSPAVGESILVERPGFPFNGEKAEVVGVGIALDDNGFFAADAEFLKPVDWPVHSSVRVIVTRGDARVLVPFTAVWWDDSGASNVWLVMENGVIRSQAVKIGRAVGDRVEVEDGLKPGDQFVSKASPDLKTGTSVYQAVEKKEGDAKESKASGDGHGHTHDE